MTRIVASVRVQRHANRSYRLGTVHRVTRIGCPTSIAAQRQSLTTVGTTLARQGLPVTMPPSGKIEVAEEGNRRKGEMTPSEMRQCAKDIVAWFTQHADLDAKGADQQRH